MDLKELKDALNIPIISRSLDKEIHSKFSKFRKNVYEKINEFYKDLGKTKLIARSKQSKLIEQRLSKDLRILYIEFKDKAYAVKITNHKHLEKEIENFKKGHYDEILDEKMEG